MDVKENRLLAYFWFVCAFLTAALIISVFNTKGVYLIPGILGLSFILIMVGRQRIRKYKLNSEAFNAYVGNAALLTAIWCGASTAIFPICSVSSFSVY